MLTTPGTTHTTHGALADRLCAYASTVAKVVGTRTGEEGQLPSGALRPIVADALDLYRQVRDADRQWSEQVRGGLSFRIEDARPIGDLYRAWLGASTQLLSALDRAPGGRTVPGRDKLSDACRAARFPATVNLDAVVRGASQLGSSAGVPLQEAMDELRRHRRA
jgi:hypothetical protein